jgi:hypothetical protein
VRAPRLLGLGVAGVFACAGEHTAGGAGRASADRPTAPVDTLVATAPAGIGIWLTLARSDSGATGRCTARAVEIRRDDRRIPVPLLYTSTAPEVVNDTTMRARLSDRCAPGDAYLVDLRTGRPVRER